jgi:hypothetical protein
MRIQLRTATVLCAALLVGRTIALANSTRIEAWGAREHALYIGSDDNWISVTGNGNSDLDCWIYDKNGRLVDSHVDETDSCILRTPGMGVHRVEVENLGDRANRYVVTRKKRL